MKRTEPLRAERAPAPLRTGSLRRRVVLAVLALLAVLLLVLSITVDQVLHQRLEGQIRQRLTDRATVAAALADKVGAQDLVNRLAGNGVSVRYRTSDGTSYTAGPPVTGAPAPQPPAGRPAPAPPGPSKDVVELGDVLLVERSLPGGVLILSADAGDLRRTLNQVRFALVAGSLMALLLAAVALVLVVGRVLEPLDTITRTARSISAGDRGRRLRPDRPDTELGRTAAAFDDMLDEIEGTERRAREAEARVRDFLNEIAHELRTPLAGVQAAAEMLVRSDFSGLELGRDERERLAVGVVREAVRASRLVEDMLTMARIDRGLDLQVHRFDLRQVAGDAIEIRRPVAPPTQALSLPPGPPVLLVADPDRITQVLFNLIDNALRAAGPSGHVGVTVDQQGATASVDVQDDGPGVPERDRERIFDRLVRLDNGRSRDAGGAGLGLSIARGIARSHGGDIVCLPTRAGALFRLTLPVAEDLGPAAARDPVDRRPRSDAAGSQTNI